MLFHNIGDDKVKTTLQKKSINLNLKILEILPTFRALFGNPVPYWLGFFNLIKKICIHTLAKKICLLEIFKKWDTLGPPKNQRVGY